MNRTYVRLAAGALALHSSHGFAATCELRIFPTDQISVVTNLKKFGLAGSILSGKDQPKEIFLRDLPAEAQTKAIAEIPELTSLLHFPAANVVRESSYIDYKIAKKQKTRLTPSTATCYAELVVATIMYTDNIVKGRRIGALMLFRRFDQTSATAKVQEFGGSGKLTLYPVDDANRQKAAVSELTDGFKAAIIEGATKFIR